MCLMACANNKGADKPAHPCSLISTFVVRCLDGMISWGQRNRVVTAFFKIFQEREKTSLFF